MGKFLSFIGLEDADDEELMEEEEQQQPQQAAKPAPRPRQRREATRPAAVGEGMSPRDIPSDMKMVVFHPVVYDDAQSIADNLKSGKPIIVNMEELDGATAQRVLDFLLGAVYALDGSLSKISRGIFLVAPKNCNVVDNGENNYTDF